MPTYHVHAKAVKSAADKAAAVNVPMFTRSGHEVVKILFFNSLTKRVQCQLKHGQEHTYDYSDLLHHLGDPGKIAHFEAAGVDL